MPQRIQRKRIKGFKLPPGAVCISRPSIWGNPFTPAGCRAAGFIGTDAEVHERCVEAFRVWLGPHWRENWDGEESRLRRQVILDRLPELKGKDLACFCKEGESCHGDLLLALANTEPQ